MAAAPPPPSSSTGNIPHNNMPIFHCSPAPIPPPSSVSSAPIPPPPLINNTPPPPPSSSSSSINTPPPPPSNGNNNIRQQQGIGFSLPPNTSNNIPPASSSIVNVIPLHPPPPASSSPSSSTTTTSAMNINNVTIIMNQQKRPPPPPNNPDPSISPNQTIYINNLNDRVKIDVLKRDMQSMFKQFGTIREIIAMKSFWRRGQVWLVFGDVESATKALNGMQGFLYRGKQMRINYAISKSDIIAKEEGVLVEKTEQKGPKKPRGIREKEEKQKSVFLQLQQQIIQQIHNLQNSNAKGGASNVSANANPIKMENGMENGVENVRTLKKRAVESSAGETAGVGGIFGGAADSNPLNFFKNTPTFTQQPETGSGPSLPNSTLFIENIGENVTKERLEEIFMKKFGFQEIRYIQSRKLAFVNFENELNATHAMNALQGYSLSGSSLKISYAKK